jgi:hypothetical protein
VDNLGVRNASRLLELPLSSEEMEQSSSWALILEARELLKIFRDIAVAKVDRVNNGVAHVLAQVGKSGVSSILCDSIPDCVSGPGFPRL